ncbi:MAG TPA: family 1 encapsulin nanocompartment shell protein [Acidimicrobiales bacterium]|nr:family 1 encapsulin nanocompartment shell protein [Acidimicrobiales bacterium]
MNHLFHELAPISDAGWAQIEDEAKSRLVPYLAARKLVDFAGPHGWGYSATNLGRTATVSSPSEGVSAVQRRVLPVVELRAGFSVSRVELDDAERGASDLDFEELDEAVRQVALAENVSVFHGYAAASVRGITECTSHAPVPIEDDMEQYPKVVTQATDVLRRAGIGGPYGLAISPEIYSNIVETTEHGGYLLLDHLRKILEGPLVWAPGVEGGVVLSLRGGDFVFDCGQDLSIGYSQHDAQVVHLYIEESFTFRVIEPDAGVALRPRA